MLLQVGIRDNLFQCFADLYAEYRCPTSSITIIKNGDIAGIVRVVARSGLVSIEASERLVDMVFRV